jgi:Cytochrome oxidase complex assembly protein 1
MTPAPAHALPPLPRDKTPDWWDRNWKWFLPVVVTAGTLIACGFVAFVYLTVATLTRSSGAYSGAIARTQASAAVAAALGTPIRPGFFVTGDISINGSSGKAELVIPVSGPKGDAAIYVEASKLLGAWHFDRLVVQVGNTGDRIDLSEGPYKPLRTRDVEPAPAPARAGQEPH